MTLFEGGLFLEGGKSKTRGCALREKQPQGPVAPARSIDTMLRIREGPACTCTLRPARFIPGLGIGLFWSRTRVRGKREERLQ